jgi:hypothetical protein
VFVAGKKQRLLCPPILIDVEITPPTAKPVPISTRPSTNTCQEQGEQSGATVPTKILTPMAVLAPTRVVADIISRGPAAMIFDRQAQPAGSISTPQQFTHLQRITELTATVGTPFYSPAMVTVHPCFLQQELGAANERETHSQEVRERGRSFATADLEVVPNVGSTEGDVVYAFAVPTNNNTPLLQTPRLQDDRPPMDVSNERLMMGTTGTAHATPYWRRSDSVRDVDDRDENDDSRVRGFEDTMGNNDVVHGTIFLSPDSNSEVRPSTSYSAVTEEEEEVLRLGSPTGRPSLNTSATSSSSNTATQQLLSFSRSQRPAMRPPIGPPAMNASQGLLTVNTAAFQQSTPIHNGSNRVSLFSTPLSTPRRQPSENIVNAYSFSRGNSNSNSENVHPNQLLGSSHILDSALTCTSAMKTPQQDGGQLQSTTNPRVVGFSLSIPSTPFGARDIF